MNEKKAKAVRRGVRRMLEKFPDWPEREYIMRADGSIALIPACRRSLYKVAKAVSRDTERRKIE